MPFCSGMELSNLKGDSIFAEPIKKTLFYEKIRLSLSTKLKMIQDYLRVRASSVESVSWSAKWRAPLAETRELNQSLATLFLFLRNFFTPAIVGREGWAPSRVAVRAPAALA